MKAISPGYFARLSPPSSRLTQALSFQSHLCVAMLNHLTILMPVYNDWSSAAALIGRLTDQCGTAARNVQVVIVDDGSSSGPPAGFGEALPTFDIIVVKLATNLGHQRALAIGIAYVADSIPDTDALVVMDSDGEDSPEELQRLLEEMAQTKGTAIVFAGRAQRSEGISFRIGYIVYRILYRILTGQVIRFGNFSVIPKSMIRKVASISEIWNHYAAAVVHAKLPIRSIPTLRSCRLDGRSQMNHVGLITHGLSAISIFADVLGVRLLIAASIASTLLLILIGVAFYLKLATGNATPGWASTMIGFLTVLLVLIFGFTLQFTFMILQSRSISTFVPIRDYRYYIHEINQLV